MTFQNMFLFNFNPSQKYLFITVFVALARIPILPYTQQSGRKTVCPFWQYL